MRVYFEPLVRVVARPQMDAAAVADFLSDRAWIQEDEPPPTDGDSLPEFAGRMCYGSFGTKQGRKTNREYLANVIEQGHGSVLEHSCWTLLVTQGSRRLTHQLVRHRAGFAFSQESTHFIDYSAGDWAICLDPRLQRVTSAVTGRVLQAERAVMVYAAEYEALRALGLGKKDACQAASTCLPAAIESRVALTANARALRHMCELRGARDNVLEMRMLAVAVLRLMKIEAPAIFADIDLLDGGDGFWEVHSQHRKV